jgi:hypothetical protein
MSDVIPLPMDGNAQLVQRPSSGEIMAQALAPLKLADRWSGPIRIAEKAKDLVAVDNEGMFVALRTTDPAERMKLYHRANDAHGDLPDKREITAAFRIVEDAIQIEPKPDDYYLLGGLMLNAIFINASETGDGFMEMLALALADVWPDVNDGRSTPGWIPIPALAAAVERIARTFRGNYGKPPYIADIIEMCRDKRRSLVCLRHNLLLVGRTQQRLGKLLDALEATMPEMDDWGIGDA